MKPWSIVILFISLFIFFLPVASAAVGFEMAKVPEGTISTVDTVLDARIENVGFDRIFVAIPSGWTPDQFNSYTRSYAVREKGLWRIYGEPYVTSTLLGSGKVYNKPGVNTKLMHQVGGETGWWLKPNEGLDIHLAVDNIGSGSIDPMLIEKENPSILVIQWEQEFEITPSATGFITAPWIVEGATLTQSNPAPISDVSQKPSELYYEEYIPSGETINETGEVEETPDWDEWFTLSSSLSDTLSTKSIVSMEPKLASQEVVEEVEETVTITYTPVWRIEDISSITYAYEWRRGEKISGILLLGPSVSGFSGFAGVPEWFDWF